MVAHVRPAVVALGALLAASFPAAAQSSRATGPAGESGSIEGNILVPVARAREFALQKLRAEGCRRILGEFEDLGGRRLEDVLAAREETAEGHLRLLVFREGNETTGCGRPGVFAYTTPGSLTIFICPSFRGMALKDPKAGANILIHEELHSLGAGEAPMPGLPSSQEITERVKRRCGA